MKLSRPALCVYCRQPATRTCDLTVRWADPDLMVPFLDLRLVDRRLPCGMPVCDAHRMEEDGRDLCRNHHRLLQARKAVEVEG